MSTPKRLQVNSAFGKSVSETILLAGHPDETHDKNGDPIRDRRTLVLRLQGDRAVFHEQLDVPLVRSWYSSTGVGYCGSVQRGTIHKWQAGRWSEETFSDQPEEFVRYVFAVPGATPDGDTLFLACQTRIYVRQAGKWLMKRAPGEGYPYQMDGHSADRVFIGGSELCMWDGKDLVSLESPRGDTVSRLAVSADDRLIGGYSFVNISTPAGTWDRIDIPKKGVFAFARFRDDVYVLTDELGVMRVYPGVPTVVSNPVDPVDLVSVGDGLLAIGEDQVMLYDGTAWREVKIPSCEVGKVPS